MPYYEKRIESGPMVEISRYFASRSGRAIPRSANRQKPQRARRRSTSVTPKSRCSA